MHMFDTLKKLFRRERVQSSKATPQRDTTLEAAIAYTIERYGGTLQDLAKYDRGEQLSR